MSIKIPFSAPLNPEDNEIQTYGCRQSNPDICKYNGMKDVCAFNSIDNICKHPSRSWAKQYRKLAEKER